MNNEQHILLQNFILQILKVSIQTVVNVMWGEGLKGWTLYKSRPQIKKIDNIINMNK